MAAPLVKKRSVQPSLFEVEGGDAAEHQFDLVETARWPLCKSN